MFEARLFHYLIRVRGAKRLLFSCQPCERAWTCSESCFRFLFRLLFRFRSASLGSHQRPTGLCDPPVTHPRPALTTHRRPSCVPPAIHPRMTHPLTESVIYFFGRISFKKFVFSLRFARSPRKGKQKGTACI